VSPRRTQTQWESFIAEHPQTHLLQTPAWGELKAEFGWQVDRVQVEASGAQVLFRKLPFGFSLAYIPKGPIGPFTPELLQELDELCVEKRAFALKIELDQHADNQEKFFLLDLHEDEETILARMNQKTRYNIRLATRKGVTARPWKKLDQFGQMIQETAIRDSFGAHVPSYYKRAYELFYPAGTCECFVAEFDGNPLAAIMVFLHGNRAWYFYGASTNKERNRMPTYLLQWEAIQWAKDRACTKYDLWGVPDYDLETLEERFLKEKGGLWGVYRFKRGFGGELVRSIGAWDRVYNQAIYSLYKLWITLRRN
jgi:peptidoglycan pentaglycine glycine transferase (the first glycine)